MYSDDRESGARPPGQFLRIVIEPVGKRIIGRQDALALFHLIGEGLQAFRNKGLSRFFAGLEENPLVIDQAEHHAIAEQALAAEHPAHRNLAERREQIIEAIRVGLRGHVSRL